jgi:hypothetical protein
MPGTETPVLVAAPAIEVQEAPAETPETVLVPAAETPALESSESEEPDPLADFDDEVLVKNPRILAKLEATRKSADASARESERQKYQAEAKKADDTRVSQEYARSIENSRLVEAQNLSNVIAGIVGETVDLEIDPDVPKRWQAAQPKVQALSNQLLYAAQVQADRALTTNATAFLRENYPDYRIPAAQVEAFDTALARGDFKARFAVLADIAAEAKLTAETPKIRADAIREYQKESEDAVKVEREKAAVATNNGQTRPTNVGGRSVNKTSYGSKLEASRLFMQGAIDKEEMRRARYNPALPET